MRTVIITGAAGFLGSHLCDRFIREGYNIIGVDNFSTGNVDNIKHLFHQHSRFTLFNEDVSEEKIIMELKDHIDRNNLDLHYILHFASPASPPEYLRNPIGTMRVGSYGIHNMLLLGMEYGAKVLIASTSEVYGDPTEHPQKETYWGNVNPIGPRSVYDEAKRFQEAITMAYHTHYDLDIGIVRIFNTYGPRMDLNDGRALPNFVKQALNGENLSVYGDGKQTRSFCYVDDLIEGIYKLIMTDYVYPVNLGNPQEINIHDFAKEIIDIHGKELKIMNQDLPKDDPKQRKPDIALAKELLGWEPKVSRKQGLKLTYDYFKSVWAKE